MHLTCLSKTEHSYRLPGDQQLPRRSSGFPLFLPPPFVVAWPPVCLQSARFTLQSVTAQRLLKIDFAHPGETAACARRLQ